METKEEEKKAHRQQTNQPTPTHTALIKK